MMKKLLMLVLAFVPAFSAAVEEAGLLETEEKIVENEATEFFTEQNTLIIEKVAETVPANEVKEAVEKDFTAHLRALRKKKRLRGTPGTQRGQAWLASNRSYVDTSLDWSANLKTMADSLTAESAKNNCEMPSREQLHESMKNICQGVSVAGQSCYYNWAIMRGGFYGLSALPSTDEAFQQLGMPKVPAGYEQVGCSDCLKEASSNNKWGYWSGVCLYYVIAPANIGLP